MHRALQVLLLLLLSLVCTGCPSKPVLELHSARLQSATPTGVGLDVYMRVNNENAFDVQIRNVRANVTIAQRYVLPPIQYNPDQWLGANQSTLVRVPMVVPWHLVAPLVSTTAGSDTIGYRVTGLADVTAVRMLGIEANDYELDEQGAVSRAELLLAAGRGALQ